mmetsp:Transcript_17840/g.31059  ORF Transcript_17840/g.31059 Transcript_17840/m.31059 type:complete len:299 (-) Transcript_17840:897-1793(-)
MRRFSQLVRSSCSSLRTFTSALSFDNDSLRSTSNSFSKILIFSWVSLMAWLADWINAALLLRSRFTTLYISVSCCSRASSSLLRFCSSFMITSFTLRSSLAIATLDLFLLASRLLFSRCTLSSPMTFAFACSSSPFWATVRSSSLVCFIMFCSTSDCCFSRISSFKKLLIRMSTSRLSSSSSSFSLRRWFLMRVTSRCRISFCFARVSLSPCSSLLLFSILRNILRPRSLSLMVLARFSFSFANESDKFFKLASRPVLVCTSLKFESFSLSKFRSMASIIFSRCSIANLCVSSVRASS